MNIKDKIIKWCGGYTQEEHNRIKTAAAHYQDECMRLKANAPVRVKTIPMRVLTLKACSITSPQELTYVSRAQIEEELARTLGEEMYKNHLITYEENKEKYLDTTGSIEYTGTVRIAQEDED